MKRGISIIFLLLVMANSHAQNIFDPGYSFFSLCQKNKNQFNSNLSKLSGQSYADTLHIYHYDIWIDTIDFSAKSIRGKTTLSLVNLIINPPTFELDFEGLIVDSIVDSNGTPLLFTHLGSKLSIQTISTLNLLDTSVISIYYHGNPIKDVSGWGGFYFSGNYAFNLGVGFQANPHNFGRVWYPCLDVFDDKSFYDFHITTSAALKAFCNGTLVNIDSLTSGEIRWHWNMSQRIPSYLASISVGPYFTLEQMYNGIPTVHACNILDTNNTKSTFVNMQQAIDVFTEFYGPYMWDKIGFVQVPFNQGAMEHASSIHIGKSFINGLLTYETLWAHELSHMWWGDLVTCLTAEDMWLNEGWASYSEALFTQKTYGLTAYKNWIRNNHRQVIQFAHTPARDGSYLALNNVPHAYTYGATVYNKGADIAHTLRFYMGDSLFKTGVQAYMTNLQFSNASSNGFRDELTSSTGLDMNRFFLDWIETPGFPHFSIDSVVYFPGGLDHYFVYTRQRSVGNNHVYSMPVDITFRSKTSDTTVTILIDSATNMFHIPLLFVADWYTLDQNEKISDAITESEVIVKTAPANVAMTNALASLAVSNAGIDSSVIRIEHNWVQPDPFKGFNYGIRLSDRRYWKVDGFFDLNFHSKCTLTYNGTISTSSGYLDNSLITGSEDSLVLLYRSDPGKDWILLNGVTRLSGPNLFDKIGSFVIDTLLKGEYTLGYYDYTVMNIGVLSSTTLQFIVFPNPTSDQLSIAFPQAIQNRLRIEVTDLMGKVLSFKDCQAGEQLTFLSTKMLSAGTYFIRVYDGVQHKSVSFVKL